MQYYLVFHGHQWLVWMVDGHACTPLRDCVANILAHGLELDVLSIVDATDGDNQFVMKIHESHHAQRISICS